MNIIDKTKFSPTTDIVFNDRAVLDKEAGENTNEDHYSYSGPQILDSGNRSQFSTGAVRDEDEKKGRMDLVPLDTVADILKRQYEIPDYNISSKVEAASCVLQNVEHFMWNGDIRSLQDAFIGFGTYVFGNLTEAILALSMHYKNGALKYKEHNWRLGISLNRYCDSGPRHLMKWYRGDMDEPHAEAALWNIIGAIWTVDHLDRDNAEVFNVPWCFEGSLKDRLMIKGDE